MKFWVAVTDNEWFKFLSGISPDEVNFWQPSGNLRFRAIDCGALFLFKLHSPLNFITGGGFFVRHTVLPLSIAWETFKEKNGAPNYQTFRSKIMHYREKRGDIIHDPSIGCITLTSPFFFRENKWIPVPKDWSSNIVQGKTYDTNDSIGLKLWSQVKERLRNKNVLLTESKEEYSEVFEQGALYGSEFLARARLGDGAFRVLVTDAYNRRCAITGEKTLPALEAAHIKPYSESGPHSINNGLLLRADLHKLFDKGYMTITNDFNLEVSKRVKEEYENGKEYYKMHGNPLIVLPDNDKEYPARKYVEWHNQNIFIP